MRRCDCYSKSCIDCYPKVDGLLVRFWKSLQRAKYVLCNGCAQYVQRTSVKPYFIARVPVGFLCCDCEWRQEYTDLPWPKDEYECPKYTCNARHQHIPDCAGPAPEGN